jgi:hypothetical protein
MVSAGALAAHHFGMSLQASADGHVFSLFGKKVGFGAKP